jgi:hypothetical protein
MTRGFALIGIIICCGLFIMCPKAQASPERTALKARIQGHVCDGATSQPIAGQYVALFHGLQSQRGMPTLVKAADTQTDSTGLYTLQATIPSDACKAGSAKPYLAPIQNDDGTGTQIVCVDSLQTIDLVKK